MKCHNAIKIAICGAAAGAIAGLFGAGGGMVLVPLLTALTDLNEKEVFPASISILLPVCIVSVFFGGVDHNAITVALPYLIGSAAGGILSSTFGRKIPTAWLHRLLGLLILWGGIRYLW